MIFFLLIVSSNLRNASTYQDSKGKRTIQRSTRNQTETNRLERAKCPVCERVLNFPALTLFRRETTKTISGRQKEAFLLLLLDICNGTRSKNRWIGFFASAHFRSYTISPRRKNKRGSKCPRGPIHHGMEQTCGLYPFSCSKDFAHGIVDARGVVFHWHKHISGNGIILILINTRWEIVVSCLPVEQ